MPGLVWGVAWWLGGLKAEWHLGGLVLGPEVAKTGFGEWGRHFRAGLEGK